MHRPSGFSLIELVIVVIIIGIIGAIAIPRLSRGSEAAGVNAFVNEINNFAKVIDLYQLETGNAIGDSTTGVFPSELTGYLHENSWSGQTPLGGYWDIERDDNGVGLAVGVDFRSSSPRNESMQQVDEMIDDGNLDSGAFRFLGAGRYYLVLEN
ncbi:MAG: prepilin-type N-terminal cleavage/methylation domain-containing protein [Phycisphaeraceae bacterium]